MRVSIAHIHKASETMSEANLSNEGWMYLQAVKAKTAKEIAQVELDLDNDRFENMEYTRNPTAVRRIEQAIDNVKKKYAGLARTA